MPHLIKKYIFKGPWQGATTYEFLRLELNQNWSQVESKDKLLVNKAKQQGLKRVLGKIQD